MIKTITDFLDFHANRYPNDLAFRYLIDGENQVETLTYSQLRAKAQTLAMLLKDKVTGKSNAILLYTPGLDFIVAFLACLYAGITAVPTYPPIPRRLTINLMRLEKICDDCKSEIILADSLSSRLLTTALLKENCKGFLDNLMHMRLSNATDLKLNSVPVFVTDDLESPEEYDFDPPFINQDQNAFIQYSSGSTGHPKGIIVSHENLMANIGEMTKVLCLNSNTVAISWLPFYHDMGLIGFTLLFLVNKLPVTYLSPFAFLQNPLRWLKAIDKYKGTISGCPNSGLE